MYLLVLLHFFHFFYIFFIFLYSFSKKLLVRGWGNGLIVKSTCCSLVNRDSQHPPGRLTTFNASSRGYDTFSWLQGYLCCMHMNKYKNVWINNFLKMYILNEC